MARDDCIFCKIAAGELPANVVDEDERTLTFMDINPATRGHALVIPRAHSREWPATAILLSSSQSSASAIRFADARLGSARPDVY